jgi:RNase P subunit RPR2
MLISCSNKGCLKSSTALLKLDTMEVICQECGKPIAGISDAMKRTLKSFGQIVRSSEKKAFMMLCRSCNANRQLLLDENGNTICKTCHNPIVVQASFRLAMEEAGQKIERLIVSQNPPEKK